MHVDGWTILSIILALSAAMGWVITIPLNNLLLIYCNWREGADIDWGWEIGCVIATPFAFIFTILEVILLFSN